jgi:hypothetical protein
VNVPTSLNDGFSIFKPFHPLLKILEQNNILKVSVVLLLSFLFKNSVLHIKKGFVENFKS